MLVVLIYAASAQLFAAINRSHPSSTTEPWFRTQPSSRDRRWASQCRGTVASARSPL